MPKAHENSELVAVVLAMTGTGLAVARAVSTLGPVIAIDAERSRPGLYSRHVVRHPQLTHRALDAALVEPLIEFAHQQKRPVVVVPAADDACEWVADHRDALAGHVRFSAGYSPERSGLLLDKWAFGDRCRELGIDVPLTYMPQTLEDVRSFAQEIGLPCIVKPRAGHLWRNRLSGQKLLVPETMEELLGAMETIVGDPKAVVLQELVAGPERNLGVAAAWVGQDGTLRHLLTARKIRQFPRQFGSGSRVVTEALPEVARLSAEVLQRLDYRGVCGTEYKYDLRHQRWRLIEINPRPTLWYDLCRAAGSDLLAAHVRELAGLEPGSVSPQRQGVAWEYGLRDAVALGQSGGPAALWRALRAEGLPHTDAVMALDDPGATAAAAAHFVGQALSHLRPRLGKKRGPAA